MITVKMLSAAGVVLLMTGSSLAAGNSKSEGPKVNIVQQEPTNQNLQIKPPVLISASPHSETTSGRPIARIKIEPLDKPLARDASETGKMRFTYTYDKDTKSKIYRPTMSNKAEKIPNLFED